MAQQTKNAIRRAFIQLLNERPLDKISIKDEIKKLDDRERNIMYLRFMQGKTQMEVAREVGISQAQVSRLEKNALKRIKGE